MTPRASRRATLAASVLLGGMPLALVATPGTDQPTPALAAPVVYTAVVDAIIHPVSADYMIHTMDQGQS